MAEKETEFKRKRELGDIFSDSFEFIRQEYKPLSKLILRYVLPFLILYGFVQVYVQIKVFGNIDITDPESLMGNLGPFYKNIFLFSLFGVFVQALLISTFYTYIEIYIRKGKGNFDLSEITPHLFSNGLIALGASLAWYFVSIIGLMLCLIPGIYFANTYSLIVGIVLFERKGIVHAMSRSWNLVMTQWWNTLLINIVGILITWFAGFILSTPAMILGIGTSIGKAFESGATEQPALFWILTVSVSVISSLFWIVPYTFLAFQYFNLSERENPTIQPDQEI
jgi:hypothetical protein